VKIGSEPDFHKFCNRGFHLADFFTLANAACGVGAAFLAMLYSALPAAA
jgi:CDP-diacylglycerol---serine O-phosphatidyltransferase